MTSDFTVPIQKALRAKCSTDFLKLFVPPVTPPQLHLSPTEKVQLAKLRDFIATQPYNLSERELYRRCQEAGFYSKTSQLSHNGHFVRLTAHRYDRTSKQGTP